MNEQETLDFYRQAYQASHARAEALEKSRDRLFEREAQHTEAYGMVCQERDHYKARAEEAQRELRETFAIVMDCINGRISDVEALKRLEGHRQVTE